MTLQVILILIAVCWSVKAEEGGIISCFACKECLGYVIPKLSNVLKEQNVIGLFELGCRVSQTAADSCTKTRNELVSAYILCNLIHKYLTYLYINDNLWEVSTNYWQLDWLGVAAKLERIDLDIHNDNLFSILIFHGRNKTKTTKFYEYVVKFHWKIFKK